MFRHSFVRAAALIALSGALHAGAQANPAIAEAAAAVEAARVKAEADPARPVYHVLPPANWNNDPNGPIYHDGYYHLFYQHNPYGDRWDHMHWGHVRSKDLVHWEHLPIALWPSKDKGEDHCFSGCAAIAPDGTPLLIYTSIGARLPEQWAARPLDPEWRTWEKLPENPIMTEALHGEQKIHEWRDPYIFTHHGVVRAVVGGNLNASKGGQASVQVYRATNEALTQWTSEGVLFVHPDADAANIECPNFFPLAGRWALIVSPHKSVQFFTGNLSMGARFQWTQRGIVDYGDYYAPNGCFAPDGRHMLWGWVRGFPEGRGWNGCMSLPRVLSLDAAGRILQAPAPELEALRGNPIAIAPEPFDAERVIDKLRGDALEIACTLRLDGAKRAGLRLRQSDDARRAVPLVFDGKSVDLAGVNVPLPEPARTEIGLRIFLDKSVVELYIDRGAHVVTKVIDAPPADLAIAAFAEGGPARLDNATAWPIGSIW